MPAPLKLIETVRAEEKKAYDFVYRATHAKERKATNAAYYAVHAEELKAYGVAYYATHKEERKAYGAAYYAARAEAVKAYQHTHKEKIRNYQKNYRRARIKNDVSFKLRCRLSTRIWNVLTGKNKAARTKELLGCSIEFLREHLEKQFVPGMSWENYGPIWHVDHIKPCAKFDLSDPDQQKACFHFSNLQPLWALENILKSDNYAGK